MEIEFPTLKAEKTWFGHAVKEKLFVIAIIEICG